MTISFPLDFLALDSADLLDQTLPIGYYPTLSDDDLDRILLDQSISTVEYMITPAAQAKGLNPGPMVVNNSFVGPLVQLLLLYAYLKTG